MAIPTSSAQLADQLRALAAATASPATGEPVEFTPEGAIHLRPEARTVSRGGAEDAAAIIRTSGSTGTPKQTVLTTSSLAASAEATAQLIGEGQWLLAVGTQFVAGLAVLSRSLIAGTTPALMPPGSFSTDTFCAGVRQLRHARTYVSLVPTQLARLLAEDQPASDRARAVDALRSFEAILVGGAAIPAPLVSTARELGLNLYLTYGSSETSGGCVYNGTPLPGVTASTVDYNVPGSSETVQRLQLTGPMVAAGYLDAPELTAEHFHTDASGQRSYLTDDEGTATTDHTNTTRVTVTGRIDDVLITGGVKVSAGAVQRVLTSHPEVRDAFVTGVPDSQWGQRITAVIVPATMSATEEYSALQKALCEAVRSELGAAAVPKQWHAMTALPQLPNGKTDRQQLISQVQKTS